MDKISQMVYNEASFQLKMMLSSEFLCTKFLLLIYHPQKPRKFHTAKILAIWYYQFKVNIPTNYSIKMSKVIHRIIYYTIH